MQDSLHKTKEKSNKRPNHCNVCYIHTPQINPPFLNPGSKLLLQESIYVVGMGNHLLQAVLKYRHCYVAQSYCGYCVEDWFVGERGNSVEWNTICVTHAMLISGQIHLYVSVHNIPFWVDWKNVLINMFHFSFNIEFYFILILLYYISGC